MQAVMTCVTVTFIMVASSLTVTNSVTLSVERSCSSRSNSSFIRSATNSRFSLRYLAPLFLPPFAVNRARVSFICFETSSSLTSGRTTGFGALLFLFLLRRPSPGRGWFWLLLPLPPGPWPGRDGACCPGVAGLLPPRCCWARLRSTFSFERRLRLCFPPGTIPVTSIVPSTLGPASTGLSGRKVLSFGGAGAGVGAGAGFASAATGAGVATAAGVAAGAGAGVAATGAGAGAGACTGFSSVAGAGAGAAGASVRGADATGAGAGSGAGAGLASGCGAAFGLGFRSIFPRKRGC